MSTTRERATQARSKDAPTLIVTDYRKLPLSTRLTFLETYNAHEVDLSHTEMGCWKRTHQFSFKYLARTLRDQNPSRTRGRSVRARRKPENNPKERERRVFASFFGRMACIRTLNWTSVKVPLRSPGGSDTT
ncbi:MAG: hypothetical protein [Circular genetic element sp.]|nr:MAG: hypothetical protein [Circular genetic element sp.]